MNLKKLKRLLQIDKHSLDEEWATQSDNYAECAEAVADARRDWEQAKATLEVERCELDKKIRSNPDAFGIAKLTEAQIATTIGIQPSYKALVEDVIEKHHAYGVWDGFLTAMDHKKSGLGKLVDLLLANYYSKPKSSSKSREHTEVIERRAARRRS